MDLLPFDPNARCVKCNYADVGTSYHPNVHGWACILRGLVSRPECCSFEHQERTCRRCHYSWAEGVA